MPTRGVTGGWAQMARGVRNLAAGGPLAWRVRRGYSVAVGAPYVVTVESRQHCSFGHDGVAQQVSGHIPIAFKGVVGGDGDGVGVSEVHDVSFRVGGLLAEVVQINGGTCTSNDQNDQSGVDECERGNGCNCHGPGAVE